MVAARRAPSAGQRWRHLERAHVVSQPDPWLHSSNHAAMLILALRQRDRHEALGQVVRRVLPRQDRCGGTNTVRVDVGLKTPWPYPSMSPRSSVRIPASTVATEPTVFLRI
nr:DUF3703 domain-containing protein [Mycolicibacterium sp. TUM20985]